MSSIDDPIEAVRRQYPEESLDPLGIALRVVTPAHPLAAVGSAIKNFFSQKEAKARVEALFTAFEWYIRNHDKSIEEIKATIESPTFVETILVAVNKAMQTANAKKVKRFATILGYEAVHEGTEGRLEDAAAFIRTLEELGERDIEALRLLHRNQGRFFDSDAYRDPNVVTNDFRFVIPQIEQYGFSQDEFFARCSKLSGYGLTLHMELRGNLSAVAVGEYVFRLTGLGNKLATILLSAKDDEIIPQ
jgi:hypothetical protein